MSVRIVKNNYGKARVRLVKVARDTERHELQNLTVNIALEGDFDTIHTIGDNSNCLPTDTMKNTVYALAGQTREIEETETFGRRLAAYFLANNEQVSCVTIDIFRAFGWKRMKFDGVEHDHSFVKGSGERHTVRITADRDVVTIESGVEDLIVLKTTRSGFVGFIKDTYTTLPEATDRIFSTAIKSTWSYATPDVATETAFQSIRQTILRGGGGGGSLPIMTVCLSAYTLRDSEARSLISFKMSKRSLFLCQIFIACRST